VRGSRVHKRQLSNRRIRQREPKLRAELLAATLRYVGESILSCDARGRITSANPAAEQLLGRSATELEGELLRAVLALRTLDGKG
jgi:PAS domain-containing protein